MGLIRKAYGVVHLLCTHRGGGGGPGRVGGVIKTKTPYAFLISVILEMCVHGGGRRIRFGLKMRTDGTVRDKLMTPMRSFASRVIVAE